MHFHPHHQNQNPITRSLARSKPIHSFCLRDNALVLPTRDIVQCALEMLLGSFQAGALLVCLQIRVDELDEAVEVFCCDLEGGGWLVCMYVFAGERE